MLAAYIVARLIDQLAERTGSEGLRGSSIAAAIVAAGIAVVCAVLIVQQGTEAARAVEDATREMQNLLR